MTRSYKGYLLTRAFYLFGFYCLGIFLGSVNSFLASWVVFMATILLSFAFPRCLFVSAVILGSLQSASAYYPGSARKQKFTVQSFSLLPVKKSTVVVREHRTKKRYFLRRVCFSLEKRSACPFFKESPRPSGGDASFIRMNQAGKWGALLLGDPGGFNAVERALLARSGIGHLLAVSGLHVAIILNSVMLSFFLFQITIVWLLPSWTYMRSFAVSRLLLQSSMILVLLYYSGGAASVGRCCLTLSCSFGVKFFLPSLSMLKRTCLSLMLTVLLSGSAIFEKGFLLSLCAYAVVLCFSHNENCTSWSVRGFTKLIIMQCLLCLVCFVTLGSSLDFKKVFLNLLFMNLWGPFLLLSTVAYWLSWDMGMAIIGYFDGYFFRFLAFLQEIDL